MQCLCSFVIFAAYYCLAFLFIDVVYMEFLLELYEVYRRYPIVNTRSNWNRNMSVIVLKKNVYQASLRIINKNPPLTQLISCLLVYLVIEQYCCKR
jgi:hypothetical protein